MPELGGDFRRTDRGELVLKALQSKRGERGPAAQVQDLGHEPVEPGS
jgi:hypothetical protein